MNLRKHFVHLTLICLFFILLGSRPKSIQAFNHTAATVDAAITAAEYANNTAYNSSGTVWYMVWDNSDLYIGITNANINEAMVVYIDTDPQIPVNGGTNSNGSITGQTYDSTNFAELQFRANFVIYIDNGYREYRTSDGSGGWSSATTAFGSYSGSNPTQTREVRIPWSAMGGRPTSFNWFGYVVSNSGYVYGEVPVENNSGNIGTSAREVRYFTVSDTGATSSQDPFTRNSYVFNSTTDQSGFGAISVWDFTMNDSGLTITRGSGSWAISGNLMVNDGTVSFGATTDSATVTGDVTINGTLALSTASGGDLTVGGNWVKGSGGTFSNNDRSVYFNGGDAQQISGAMSGSTNRFATILVQNNSAVTFANNVGIETSLQVNSGSSFSSSGSANFEQEVAGAGVLDCDGSCTFNNLTIRDINASGSTGTIDVNGNFVINNASSNFTAPGAGISFNIGGNFTNNISSGTFSANGGTIGLDGSVTQTIGGSGTTTFNGLTVNNSSGVSLGVGARVEGVLTLTSGRITLNTYNLTLGPSATTSGIFSAGNMIVADSTGQVRKEFSGTGSFTFPVGDATSTAEYSPATVNFGSGTFGGGAYVGLTLSDAKHGNNGSADHITRYWTLTQSGISSFSADVSFSYLDADIVGTEANLYGAKYDGSTWTILNAANTGANTVGGTVSSFSDFTAGNSTLPVTLAYFQATRRGDSTYFNWQTATETGNVGFNLYVEGKDGLQLVNPQLIASAAVDSLEPQPYTFTANGLSGDVFYIEDVDLFGRRLLHGPFGLGNSYGEWVTVEAIDWAAIQAEQEALTAVRLPAGQPPANQVDLLVSQDGIYRLTYEQLLAFGLDLAGKRTNQLRLTNKGVSVPVYVSGPGATFGPGGYIEFYGQAVDSVYTHTNLYNLSVGGNVRVKVDSKAIPNQPPAGYYLATVTVENNLAYSQTAPNGDPWYRNTLLAYTSPVVGNYAIQINNYVAGATASLTVDVWGNTDWPEYSPDHHLQVSLNGTQVADGLFNGIVSYPVNVTIPAGVLQEGNNTVTLRLPGDSGAPFDMIALDSYSVTYPRSFVAENGKLQFSAAASVFAVQNLPSPNVVVYRLNGAGLARMQTVQVVPAGNGTYTASFRGLNSIATYFVYAVESLPTPTLQTPRPFTDIKTGSAQYLVIAHPNFIAGIQPLVAKHQSDGLTTKVVDLFDIYAQYGYGMVYPQAIQDYIAYAAANMGTQYVLLVGGDTYDYFNYTGSGSISFVPTLYAATDALVKYAPVDSLYADVDDDGVPDLAIGRFPVRTVAELDLLVNKTLVYAAKDYGNTAVFAADATSGIMSYGNESDGLISLLPAGWTTTSAYIDSLGVTAARQTLLDSLNSGVALTNYFGHSGPTMWTFLGLFNTTYAANLTNSGRPTVVNQWGCWNTYHVTPAYNTLAHVFMLSGDRGAAAVLGSATLTQSSSDKALGQLMTPLLAQPGVTIGDAIWQAKQQLALQNGTFTDVILGFTLLGDPALLITP